MSLLTDSPVWRHLHLFELSPFGAARMARKRLSLFVQGQLYDLFEAFAYSWTAFGYSPHCEASPLVRGTSQDKLGFHLVATVKSLLAKA